MAERSALTQVVQLAAESSPGTENTTADEFVELSSVGIEPSPSVEMDRFRPMGQKYQAFTALGKETVSANVSGRATYTELVYPLSSIVATPTPATVAGGSTATSWVFESDANDADTYTTYTVKHGDSNFYDDFLHGLFTELSFSFTRNSVDLSGSLMGKAMDTSATSGTAAALSGSASKLSLIPVLPTQVSVYLDDVSGTIGTTKLSRVLSADWSLGSRFSPVWPIDAALGTTFAAMIESEPDLTASLSMMADDDGMELLHDLRDGDRKLLRIEATGAQIDAGATAAEDKVLRLTIDTCVEFVDSGGFNDNDGVYTVDWSMIGVVDTASKIGTANGLPFSIEVINELTSLDPSA